MNVQKYVVLFLAVCCLFSGCSSVDAYPNDNIYHFETDAQIPMYSCATERSFAESEDGYYFVLTIRGNHFLFFADKETMEVLPLAASPTACIMRNLILQNVSYATPFIMEYYIGPLFITIMENSIFPWEVDPKNIYMSFHWMALKENSYFLLAALVRERRSCSIAVIAMRQ